uniref:Eco57I restriction-modification methylase domain-containing protein n=1 Tax=Vibrio cholerae TaxID=666 RepID=UPI001A32D220
KPVIPFCWEVEYPEVFHRENGGFDAFVGNPPFAGKNTTIEGNRDYFVDWLKLVHDDSHGNSDLSAHFFRRAFSLLGNNGSFGLISTNSIRQGDTRRTGLKYILGASAQIYSCITRLPWPGKAAVNISILSVLKGKYFGEKYLDGKTVPHINSYLISSHNENDPFELSENDNLAFQGSIPLGKGFIFEGDGNDKETNSINLVNELYDSNPLNQQALYPYYVGADFTDLSSIPNTKYIINFKDHDEEHVKETWPELYEIVLRKVKKDRAKQKRGPRRERWWQYAEKSLGLYRATSGLPTVLACNQTGKFTSFSFLPGNAVYDQTLLIFAFYDFWRFGVLQSTVHDEWARFFGSTLEDRRKYTPKDCFRNFPFPVSSQSGDLEKASRSYLEFRESIKEARGIGLTKVYSLFHDPDVKDEDILSLRGMHVGLDCTVLASYGWHDIQPNYVFEPDYEVEEGKSIPWRYRWPDELRDEVLARLLTLNKERHQQETH